jgi:hypothetical protein
MDETYNDLDKTDNPQSVWIYLRRDGAPFIGYDKRNGLTLISGPEIGVYLRSLFNLDSDQIEEIMKIWLNTRYGLEPRFVEFYNY